MKIYKVSDDMKPYIVAVLKRDGIKYGFVQKDNVNYLSVDLSSRQFKIFMEDAFCEKERDSTLSKIPVYSNKTLHDKDKLHRLRNIYQSNAFRVLKKDRIAYRRSVGLYQ